MTDDYTFIDKQDAPLQARNRAGQWFVIACLLVLLAASWNYSGSDSPFLILVMIPCILTALWFYVQPRNHYLVLFESHGDMVTLKYRYTRFNSTEESQVELNVKWADLQLSQDTRNSKSFIYELFIHNVTGKSIQRWFELDLLSCKHADQIMAKLPCTYYEGGN